MDLKTAANQARNERARSGRSLGDTCTAGCVILILAIMLSGVVLLRLLPGMHIISQERAQGVKDVIFNYTSIKL